MTEYNWKLDQWCHCATFTAAMQRDENVHISDITDDQVLTFTPGWARLQNKQYLGVWAAPQMKQFVSNFPGPACRWFTEDSGHSGHHALALKKLK